MAKAKKHNPKEESIEKQLWKAADKLRKNIDAAEYKHIVLGLIFLKYISDAFEELYNKLQSGEGEFAGADPEDKDEYKAENVFFVPEKSRWSYLQSKAKQPEIGKEIDSAMDAIERINLSLKDVLPKVYARQNLDPTNLGGLIDLIGNIALGDAKARSADLLRKDGRWKYGTPPVGNANYAWIQHFLYHLSPSGQAGFVLAKGSLTSKTSGEGSIRKELIEARLVDCTVNLPAKLFLNTQIPASLWFLSRNKANGKFRNCTDEILFIDAKNMGHLINRRTRELSEGDITYISETYHKWRNSPTPGPSQEGNMSAESSQEGNISTGTSQKKSISASGKKNKSLPWEGGPKGREGYTDIPGFCNSASIERVRELDYVLTPGRYVGLPDDEDDFDFNERFTTLRKEFEDQLKEEERLNTLIKKNLKKVKLV